jgi:hypothetical protein
VVPTTRSNAVSAWVARVWVVGDSAVKGVNIPGDCDNQTTALPRGTFYYAVRAALNHPEFFL